ncbi:J domain-containing protein [Geitlerinema sp. P-1104]|uniref:J domain-containing protein n=1 Tax=Geitlerinema sp. P-1104 TaxID=2546230 RepID=UPI001476D704|nr:J domain-containing protein [Geitlerinema sp. P-1104]NMG61012.1 J domain-containing protein [Geitlerinema sp. P-1104]
MSFSFDFNRGLFTLDFTDHHAILGVGLDAETKAIRKRYLNIARCLHPDVCQADNRDLAQSILSKLVNPAYSKFSNERESSDYIILLRMLAKRLQQEYSQVELQSAIAKSLMETANYEVLYQKAVSELAQQQYQDLNRIEHYVGELSELNLVYLYRREQQNKGWAQPSKRPSPSPTAAPPPPPRASTNTFVEQYLQRARSLMEQKNFAHARKELQDAIKLEPENSRCHGLLALVYLKQQEVQPSKVNLTMANSHTTKALKIDPKEPLALEARKTLTRMMARPSAPQTKPKSKPPKKSDKTKKSDKGGGGLFGLFGNKKN